MTGNNSKYDANLLLCDGATLTDTSYETTNVGGVDAKINLGAEPKAMMLNIDIDSSASGGTQTYAFRFETNIAEAFNNSKTHYVDFNVLKGVIGHLQVPVCNLYAWVRLRFIGANTPSLVVNKIWLSPLGN